MVEYGGFIAWNWAGRESPPPHFDTSFGAVDPNIPGYWQTVEGLNIYRYPNEYAFVDTGNDKIPCRAVAHGGNIDVDCRSGEAGTLTVYENQWSGWRATRDGQSVGLGQSQWLSVAAPAGEHHYEFRYRPWDVAIGLLLTAVGLAACVWLWLQPQPAALEDQGALQMQ